MDHIFEGLPQDKWLDIIFNASRTLSSKELHRILERLATLEILLEKRLGESWEEELNYIVNSEESSEEIHRYTQNIAIDSMGKILSQNE
ncbi:MULTISPECIES: DUF2018 family protein [Helicobacter]|uniref:DUF2018 family protein n=1 Tax=Helicobacter ibis TaxID=2962633 RepID=A0ABT4VHN4_9HELI|nr:MULTISPECIES: DUF2018 family protein [Helicobacter]MDA3968025.1 DUF2018 family protein [Helicobacter sp. WB40]MDA3969693.1 DUF2018 family protein [Helicobacter ibis]